MKLSQLSSIQSFIIVAAIGSGALFGTDGPQVAASSGAQAVENSSREREMNNSDTDLQPEATSVEFFAVMARHRQTDLTAAMESVGGGRESQIPANGFEPTLGKSASPIAQAVISLTIDRPLQQPIEIPSSVTTSQPTSTRVADSATDAGSMHVVLLAGR